ncbi:ScbA/BarX family gamma-butyrolactone biosynthesis protein [Streptomyces sp. NPDC052236]|uniref:ScbA/BarX family gamma-butyrolactone biosynthesis protein n=1 Tax=Streptomyces sp. NPDC052236 TaxID=3365686 RepID=UPI0037D6ED30
MNRLGLAHKRDLQGDGVTGNSGGRERLSELPQLTTTVPREYVHRASLAEVFLTGCVKTGENTFALTGQWPRAHTFFNSSDGRSHDPLQAGETIRQVGLCLAHSEFGIPLGHHFVMRDISVTARPEHLGIEHTPSDLTIEAVSAVPRRASAFDVSITIRRKEHVVAVGEGHFTCVSPAAYRRLRGTVPAKVIDYRPTGLAPSDFGRTLPGDMVLAPAGRPGLWRLNPDPTHPVMFDHDGDHIPGMVLLEAARQGACALLGPGTSVLPTTTVTRFQRYVEFGSPCWVKVVALPAQQPGTLSVRVTGQQDGHEVFSIQLSGPVVPSGQGTLCGKELPAA